MEHAEISNWLKNLDLKHLKFQKFIYAPSEFQIIILKNLHFTVLQREIDFSSFFIRVIYVMEYILASRFA